MRLRLCLSALASALALHGAGAWAQEPRPRSCSLHLWGAQQDFAGNRRLAGPAAPRGSWDGDRANALANINLLDPVRRAGDLDDAALTALLPNAANVEIVRHSQFVEIGRANRTRAPLHEPERRCSADLVVMDLYDIDGPIVSMGLLIDLLRAPSGWHVTYVFRLFDQSGRLVNAERESMVAPLRLLRSDWPGNPPAALAAIDEAMDASLSILRQRLERRSR